MILFILKSYLNREVIKENLKEKIILQCRRNENVKSFHFNSHLKFSSSFEFNEGIKDWKWLIKC